LAYLEQLGPYLVPILALLIPIVAIVGKYVTTIRREELIHETMRQLSERGQPIPPELLAGLAQADGKRKA
jgi:hypothetical protein